MIATRAVTVYLLACVKTLFGKHCSVRPRRLAGIAAAVVAVSGGSLWADSRGDAFVEFRTLFEAGDYRAAIEPARRVVELTEQVGQADTAELQASLMNLATTQRLGEELVGAEESYLRVIELIEADGRPVAPRLARANAGLASVYYAGRRYDLAAERFETAITLGRRTQGLFTEARLPILEMYADTLTELRRYEEALRVQKYRVQTVNHLYGRTDPRTVPTLVSLGRWYARVGAYDESRQTLIEAIGIIEESGGRNAPELVSPLTALAECHRLRMLDPTQSPASPLSVDRLNMFGEPGAEMAQGPGARQMAGEGEDALERAARIVSSSPDSGPAEIADIETQLGDWFQLRRRPDEAVTHYQRAWEAASRVEGLQKPLQAMIFDQPVLLKYQPPPYWNRYQDRPPDEIEIVTVEMQLTIDEAGRVREVTVLEDRNAGRLAESAERAARGALYRPRLVDGKPVGDATVRLAQSFTLLAESEPETDPD